MSISNAGIRRGSVSTGTELQARDLLEHQGHASARGQESKLPLEKGASLRPGSCHHDAGTVFDGQAGEGHKSESKAQKQMAALALDNCGSSDDGQSFPPIGQSDYHEGGILDVFIGGHFTDGVKVAEALYTKGYISYPRTETDQFDKAIDLKSLVEKQFPDTAWGQYARE